MCILFIYNAARDPNSDYSLILASNRDEYYDRPTQNMTCWSEEPLIVGGRDLEANDRGSWLAVTPTYKKVGVLLNFPGVIKQNAISRGKIVADYVRSNQSAQEYVQSIKNYVTDCNGFIFVSVQFDNNIPSIASYCNANDQLKLHDEASIGFGNSLPDSPLKKVEAGRTNLEDVCNRFNKEDMEKKLVENLLTLLKSEKRHLPDQQLETRRPNVYKELSSIHVCIPEERYGTRTHTIVLLTKNGRLSVTEVTLQMPIDVANPKWEKTEFNFDISTKTRRELNIK